MKHLVSLNKTKAKGKHHFEAWETGTGQHGASERITDPNPQLWGLWRNLHLSPTPLLGPRAGYAPCAPNLSVSNTPKQRQEGGSTSSPSSANWCQAKQHKGPLSPSVLPVTLGICSQHPSLGCQRVQLGAASSPELTSPLALSGMSKWVLTASQKQALDCFSACWRREEKRGRGG